MSEGKDLLKQACWIWPGDRCFDIFNRYAHFRKDFELKSIPQKAIIYVTADHSYRLWVNGSYVTRGPARGYQSHWPYDETDISAFLQAGRNNICAEVYNPGKSYFKYIHETAAGFICAADIEVTKIRSDASWICRFDPAHKKDTAHYSYQLALQEHADARLDDRSWISSSDVPQGWQQASAVVFGSMPWHDVEERGIPQLEETVRMPVRLVSGCSGKIRQGYENWRDVADGLYHEIKGVHWIKINEGSLKKDSTVEIPTAEKGYFSAVILDMGETVIGQSSIEITGGKAGTILDFFYCEVINDKLAPYIPNPEEKLISMANRLILAEDKTIYDFHQLIGFRYIMLVMQESTVSVNVRFKVNNTGYPYTMQGSFECSDGSLNDIWKICRRTEQVCSLDSYIDTPWREQAQWWGDARVQFWNTMAMDGDVRLFKRGIRSLAAQKVPNGLTYGHAPTMSHSCILPDFSLVWIITIYDYYRQTGDLSLFEEQLPRIYEVLHYFKNEAIKCKGLISYDKRYWLFLDWSSLEKTGSSTLYNMWYLMALRVSAQLLKLANREQEAEDLKAEGFILQEAIETQLFDNAAGLFHDGLDEYGLPLRIHSVHSQVFALMLGIKPEYHANMLQQRILPFLRGEKLEVPVPSTYWTSYVLTVAREKGYKADALEYIKRMWSPMIPYSTCFEIFEMDDMWGLASVSHAWSAHPLYHLMNILGGVVQESAGWDTIIFDPYLSPDLDFVRIKHPSPYGIIESSWARKDDYIDILLNLPRGVTARVKIPGYEGEAAGEFRCTL